MADFALVNGPAAAVAAWLHSSGAAVTRQSDQLGLAVWGEAVLAPDGRAVGAFAGALLSDLQVAARLGERGLALPVAQHAALAVTDAALYGPAALGQWRWQGALACLHLGQRSALVARDPLGVGWLGQGHSGELQITSNRLRLADQLAPLPPGALQLITPGRLQTQPLPLQGEACFFLRQRPEVDDLAALAQGLRARLGAAVQACQRGLGPLWFDATGDAAAGPPAEVPLAAVRLCAEVLWQSNGWPLQRALPLQRADCAAVWALHGAEQLLGEVQAPGEALAAPPAWEPFEPMARCDPADRPERGWRARALDAVLQPARLQAAARGQVLVAPHLDAAVLAWRGAVPRPQRRWLAGDAAAP